MKKQGRCPNSPGVRSYLTLPYSICTNLYQTPMLSCSARKRSKVWLYFVYIGNESSDESLHAQIQIGKRVRTPTADGEGSLDPPLQMGKGVRIPTENHKRLSMVVLRNTGIDPQTPRAQFLLRGGPFSPL